ncbi:tellurite resistance TerB family protein [Ectopseudomonas khazarica]|uniref:tellurite resistance TerB family protein n=1 Tax=Ectopseudomonas khazarica TaxID=2502979 RepID=UPI001AF01C91|nr:tellurite resistance TerB family protein [Pseudomonas khazarica]QTS85347.1 tellurite resistance TerB family protein [Pseudomonas khazarica]
MNTRGLLDQLLKSGQDLLQQKGAGGASSGLGGALGGLLGGGAGSGSKGGSDLGAMLKGAGGGAALAMLLGNKRVRKVGGKVAVYGGLAALGVLAYKAYGNWQAQQAQQSGAQPLEPQTLDRLPAPQAEQHSRAILKALVAAAKADGHVDARERQLIEEELGKLAQDAELQGWLHTELNKPLDPADVAGAATTPEMAAEMYLASVLMVDEEHFMERAYLEELARQLQLAPALKAELEAQVRQELSGVR